MKMKQLSINLQEELTQAQKRCNKSEKLLKQT